MIYLLTHVEDDTKAEILLQIFIAQGDPHMHTFSIFDEYTLDSDHLDSYRYRERIYLKILR